MNGLTYEQKEFLKKHNIPLNKVFDAKGLSQPEYRLKMKSLDKLIAFNVTPCRKAGHTLKTRSGHCVQCKPANIEFQGRSDSSGVVYIAGTQKGKIIKCGYSKAFEIRSESLNRTGYGSFNDWEILFVIKSAIAGHIELEIKSLLRAYSIVSEYNHDGNDHDAGEIFQCSYSKAKATLIDLCKDRNHEIEIQKDTITDRFEFRNLKKLR